MNKVQKQDTERSAKDTKHSVSALFTQDFADVNKGRNRTHSVPQRTPSIPFLLFTQSKQNKVQKQDTKHSVKDTEHSVSALFT